ncbi:hypothetical protein GGX14DRAFT_590892 [Mycena pura]|uniref:Phytocyanin domain-containing protein n=1 Tax=Mycena pura TaxID=153505 RepID=A0AAD6VPH9_9AGAR|nr:hypothetical protein GGX14DRAFT_590892 [Mycena pura]
MVLLAPLVGAAVFLSGFATALPTNYGSSSSGSSYGSSDGSSDSSSSSYGSSDGSSSYGSSGSSGYGSSDSSYGGDSSGYGGDSSYDSSSMMMMEDSSTMMMDSTETVDSTSTNTGSYGSGSSNWGGSGYEDCVNQCIAQYGSGMGGEYQATQTQAVGGYSGSGGSGATHTVIVAPSEGVFRMVPFYTNASVGDTIEWHWGAPMHTVTKSSALLPCNKSTEDPVFASGEQTTGFVFRELVNDTNPTFYYCGTPGHCEKGMFGVINPGMAPPGAPTSLGGMMSSMAANDSDLSTYAAYTMNTTSNNEAASSWGMGLDMSAFPDWSLPYVMENVMFTQNVMAMNTWAVANNGMDLSGVGNQSLKLPMDASVLNAASAGPAAASGSAAPSPAAPTPAAADATSGTAAASASPSSSSGSSNGASSVASPRFLVAAVVVLATIFAL